MLVTDIAIGVRALAPNPLPIPLTFRSGTDIARVRAGVGNGYASHAVDDGVEREALRSGEVSLDPSRRSSVNSGHGRWVTAAVVCIHGGPVVLPNEIRLSVLGEVFEKCAKARTFLVLVMVIPHATVVGATAFVSTPFGLGNPLAFVRAAQYLNPPAAVGDPLPDADAGVREDPSRC